VFWGGGGNLRKILLFFFLNDRKFLAVESSLAPYGLISALNDWSIDALPTFEMVEI
jgi:hypothetical protein